MTDARVHDLGYRPFDGLRAGVGWAVWSLGVHAVRRVFGLKRPARFKIFPFISLVIAFAPALVFVGLSILIPDEVLEEGFLPSYADYFGTVAFAVALFAALAAPEIMTSDRRTGMLALYMASPLDRTTYVVGKAGAAIAAMLSMTLLPLLFLLLANTLAGAGPDLTGFFKLLGQILAIGLLLALFFAGLSLAISSMTSRRGMASVAVVLMLLITPIVSGALVEGAEVSNAFGLLNLFGLPFESASRIFGERGEAPGLQDLGDLPVIATTALIGLGGLALTWWRYQNIEIDR